MVELKFYKKEIILTIITYAWLLFVATNVNITLGQTYLHFTLGSLVLLIIGVTIFDKKLHITFANREGGNFNAILVGLGGWIVLLITSVLVLRFVDPAHANLGAVLGLMGATTPALATSKIANILTFGVAVAFIETQLWARFLEFIADVFHINLGSRKVKGAILFAIIALSVGFVLFHLTAKGLANTSALLVVFIMMMISLSMVVIFGETRQAVYMHVAANTIASYLMLFATGMLV